VIIGLNEKRSFFENKVRIFLPKKSKSIPSDSFLGTDRDDDDGFFPLYVLDIRSESKENKNNEQSK